MTFPQTDLPLHVEIQVGSTWTELASTGRRHIRSESGVAIQRGQTSEGGSTEVSQCSFVIDNRTGRYSPRNPAGPDYGLIGRNTPVRVSVDAQTSALSIDQATGTTVATASVSTPDTATLDITGDLDLRFDGDLESWREYMELVTKWTDSGNQKSYGMVLSQTGQIIFWVSPNGSATTGSTTSAYPVPVSSGRLAVRVTCDVNDGAAGHVTTFYTAPTIAGPWTVLAGGGTVAGVLSVFAGTGALFVGDNPNSGLASSVIRGKVYAAQVYNGIGGTLVANPDFTAQTHGAASFVDSTGKTWTLNGTVSLVKRDYRFTGEIPAWPLGWDISGRDVYSPISAAGVMRRVSQGAAPLRSALFRSLSVSSAIAYWPLEDGTGSTQIADGTSTNTGIVGPMYPIGGSPNFATNTEFPGSEALLELNGAALNASLLNHANTGYVQIQFLMKIPAGSVTTSVVARMFVRGTAFRWDLIYITGGFLALTVWDVDGQFIVSSGNIAFAVEGQLLRVSVELTQDGSDVDYHIATIEIGSGDALAFSGTVTGVTIGTASRIVMNSKMGLTDTVLGHITYGTTNVNIFDFIQQFNGFSGEAAGRRFQRLCREESIDVALVGDLDSTEPMGVQRPLPLLDLLTECAFVDRGLMFEPRDFLGLGFRSGESLFSQLAGLTVPYTSLSDLEPTEDDSNLRNDVTVQRPNGSSVRAVLGSGRLSYLPPPDGVGRYDTEIETNVALDTQLKDQAGWRLHVGTVDEARYPTIEIGRENPRIAGSATIVGQLETLEIGDRVEVTGPPGWLPPETISQLVIGWQEVLGTRTRSLALVCTPASPFAVPRYARTTASADVTTLGRYSANGTTLVGSQTTTSTSWSITTPATPRWTTDSAQFPFDWMVDGERVRVTAITGTSNPQTATVTRSVNGIVKTHAAGANIDLFQRAYYG